MHITDIWERHWAPTRQSTAVSPHPPLCPLACNTTLKLMLHSSAKSVTFVCCFIWCSVMWILFQILRNGILAISWSILISLENASLQKIVLLVEIFVNCSQHSLHHFPALFKGGFGRTWISSSHLQKERKICSRDDWTWEYSTRMIVPHSSKVSEKRYLYWKRKT